MPILSANEVLNEFVFAARQFNRGTKNFMELFTTTVGYGEILGRLGELPDHNDLFAPFLSISTSINQMYASSARQNAAFIRSVLLNDDLHEKFVATLDQIFARAEARGVLTPEGKSVLWNKVHNKVWRMAVLAL